MKCSVCVDLVKPSLRSEMAESAALESLQSTGAVDCSGQLAQSHPAVLLTGVRAATLVQCDLF